nr:adenylate/guanylate cyclase domain-containing protein [Myxococcota bacterium]
MTTRAHATVLFADLIGFGALTERVGPERAYLVVTGCLQVLDSVARQHGGSVDKLLGDSMVALFGYPLPVPEAERQAVRAALAMRQAVEDYNADLRPEVPLGVKIGVNTGAMIAGEVRGTAIREFDILGDTVNVAARLKQRGRAGTIYVGPETWQRTRDTCEYQALGPMRLKGKDAPIATYELVDYRADADPGEMAHEVVATELVGRGAEGAALRERVERLAAGTGGVMCLVGDEGIGKSRLVAELRAELPEGVRVLEAAALSVTRSRPHQGFLPLLRELEVSPRELPARLERMANAKPLVFVFENLQWANADSLALLARLSELTAKSPLLLLLVSRVEPPDALTGNDAVSIRLGPLPDADAAGLVEQLLGSQEDIGPVRERLLERAAGNPARLVMGSYLASALRSEVERTTTGPQRASEAERRRTTVLFADLTGFTSLTETVGDQAAYGVVADCLRMLDEIARSHGGHVDKYMGDCVMALFGVPEAIEDAPRAAVNAAIEMRQRLAAFNEEREVAIPLRVHVGVATGLGIAGEISGPLLREFAIMGSAVQLASDLTDAAPAGSVYVDAETEALTREAFEYGALDPDGLAGGARGQAAWELRSEEQQRYRTRPGSGRGISSALVGREAELERLRAAVAGLAAGRGRIVGLLADAGLGKSRLVAELHAAAEAQDVTWLEGRSIATGQQLSFHPFADLMRTWAGIGDEDAPEAVPVRLEEATARLFPDDADEVFPFLGSLMGVTLPERQRERVDAMQGEMLEKVIRNAVTRLLRRISDERPLVLVFDDLHWADLSSIELLESLQRLAASHPVLFLLVSRPHFAETSGRLLELARGQHGEHYDEIALEPLGRDASRELIRNLFQDAAIPHRVRDLIAEQAGGNPFYVEEVVRSLLEQGAVEERDGRLHATEAIESAIIPGTVQEVIQARIDRLDLRLREVLHVASVVGRSFHLDVLSEVFPDAARLEADLDTLIDSEFLMPWDRLQGVEYAFKHPLLHEVAYDGILHTRREQLHVQVAEAITARLPTDLPGYHGMLAYHYSMGRDLERAEQYVFQAGDEAARVAASSEALHFFREASKLYLEIHGEGGDPAKRALLEKNIAFALFHRGQLLDTVEHLNRAMDLLGEHVPRHPVELGLRFVRNVARVLARLYGPRRGRARPVATEREIEQIQLMFARAQAQTTTSPTRFLFDSMETLAKLGRVDPQSVPGAGGMYAGAIGIFSFGGISFGVSQRFLDLAGPLAPADDVRQHFLYREMNLLHHLLEGDWSDALEVDDALVDENLSYGQLWEVTTYLGLVAEKRIHRGEWAAARTAIGAIDKIWDLYQYDLAKTNHYYLPTLMRLVQSRPEDALEAAEAYYQENPEDLLHLLALSAKAKAHTQLGKLDAAAQALDEGDRIVARSRPVFPFHLSSHLRSRLLLDVARLETSDDAGVRRAAAGRARRHGRAARGAAQRVAWHRPEVLRLSGSAAWLRGHRRAAQRFWAQSLDAAEQLGMRPELARTCLEAGRRLHQDGGGEIAGQTPDALLERADELFTALDMVWDQEALARSRGG